MLLETVGMVAAMAIPIWVALRFIAATPAVLTDVRACRGEWAEARFRGCEGGLEATGRPLHHRDVGQRIALHHHEVRPRGRGNLAGILESEQPGLRTGRPRASLPLPTRCATSEGASIAEEWPSCAFANL